MVKTTNFKKALAFVVAMVMVCAAFAAVTLWGQSPATEVTAAEGDMIITLQIDNPTMYVNGQATEIDPGRGTVPVVVNDRTLLPIRTVVEAVRGTVEWNEEASETTLIYGNDVIRLTIDSTTAYLNDEVQELDVAPIVMNDRTMLPIRFVAEGSIFDASK